MLFYLKIDQRIVVRPSFSVAFYIIYVRSLALSSLSCPRKLDQKLIYIFYRADAYTIYMGCTFFITYKRSFLFLPYLHLQTFRETLQVFKLY